MGMESYFGKGSYSLQECIKEKLFSNFLIADCGNINSIALPGLLFIIDRQPRARKKRFARGYFPAALRAFKTNGASAIERPMRDRK